MPQAVASGAIEMGVAAHSRFADTAPAIDVFNVPFMFMHSSYPGVQPVGALFYERAENSAYVVTTNATDSASKLDSVTVTGSYPKYVMDIPIQGYYVGCGMKADNLKVSNCTFILNTGGGLSVGNSTLTNCNFIKNYALNFSNKYLKLF